MIVASARRRYGAMAKDGLLRFWISGSMALVLVAWLARADVIALRGGGQVTGKVVPDPQNKDRVQVWLLQGRKPLSFLKSQIVEVTPKASPLDDYFEKAKKVAATAQAQYDLGAWCEQNKLTDLAKLHYEAALVSDKIVRAGAPQARAHFSRWLLAHPRRSERDPGSGQVQGAVDFHRRKGETAGRGRGGGHAVDVDPQDQDLAAGDRQRAGGPPARGGVAVDGDSRGRRGRAVAPRSG